jgi:gliding motility-associated-like protein
MGRIFIFISICLFYAKLTAQESIEPPEIERVTVLNDAGHVGLQWSFPSGQTIDGFIVYWKDPSKYPDPGTPFDTVYLASTTTVIDLSGLADLSSVYYSVAAFADEGNDFRKSPQSEPHATVYAEVSFDSCQQQNVIAWNNYVGWETNDITYRVFANSNEIGTTTDTFFVHENIVLNESYNYYVIGQNNGLASASNRSNILTKYAEPPDFINADYATVTSDNVIEVSFTTPSTDNSISYYLIRNDGEHSDTLERFTGGPEQFSFTDNDADISKPNKYKLITINTCKEVSGESNPATNVVLTGISKNNLVRLSWTPYENWLGGVAAYDIYRNTGNGYQKIGETQTTSFIDNANNLDFESTSGIVQYYILAREGNGNPYDLQGESISNVIDIVLDIIIEFPTAFTPNGDGKNDYFRAINLKFIPQSYHLTIFDRWGMTVFESKQVNQRWDGTNKKGKPAMEGVYNYQVEFSTPDGRNHIQSGYITVLYP